MFDKQQIQQQLQTLLEELGERATWAKGQIFVVGCSTSEVIGKHIGKNSSLEVAEALYEPLHNFAKKHQLFLAFQGCEHINRAITIEKAALEKYPFEPVTLIPVREAGGSMSAYAYTQMNEPVVLETINGQAFAGIDIGQTLIGMHLKQVVVPVRTSIRQIGEANVTIAITRPKLIGGERAVYTLKQS